MKAIAKGVEPRSLTEHRNANPEDYEGYGDKNTLRDYLLDEQRGICCYCMSRIQNEPKRMKVEHWLCQDHYRADRLRYGNLLGACPGNEGFPPHLTHCDTSKRNKNLLWNPAEAAHRIEAHIWYDGNGTIRSYNQTFDSELNSVLNLNLHWLKRNRKEALDGIMAWWKHEKARIHGPVPRALFIRKRKKLVPATGELIPFCQVAAWWIDLRLAKMGV